LRLLPEPDYLRSQDFLREVADIALENQLAVELQGSVLSHAYYLLRSRDVRVWPVDHFEPPLVTDTQVFDKLVRDEVPGLIQRGGERVVTRRASASELLELLKRKVVEEVLELNAAEDDQDLLDEAADVFEVLRAIAAVMGYEADEILERADVKRSERGGFGAGVVLKRTFIKGVVSVDEGNRLFDIEEEADPEALTSRHSSSVAIDSPGPGRYRLRIDRAPLSGEEEITHDMRIVGIPGYIRVVPKPREIVIEVVQELPLDWNPHQETLPFGESELPAD